MAYPDQFDRAVPESEAPERADPDDALSDPTGSGRSAARRALRSAEEALVRADRAFEVALDHQVPMSALREVDARLDQATSDHQAALAAVRCEGRRADAHSDAPSSPEARP